MFLFIWAPLHMLENNKKGIPFPIKCVIRSTWIFFKLYQSNWFECDLDRLSSLGWVHSILQLQGKCLEYSFAGSDQRQVERAPLDLFYAKKKMHNNFFQFFFQIFFCSFFPCPSHRLRCVEKCNALLMNARPLVHLSFTNDPFYSMNFGIKRLQRYTAFIRF